MGPYLPASRVLALIGALALIASFFMPWFASQGLLLSGQFLNDFLASAKLSDLQRFLPGTSPEQAALLRGLVLVFPACGACGAGVCLLLSLNQLRFRTALQLVLLVTGLVPLVAWLIGITRLPPGAAFEIGLWLIACSAAAVAIGAVLELVAHRARASITAVQSDQF